MLKTYIGIDFSLQSPGICIYDGNEYKWIGFYSTKRQFDIFSLVKSLKLIEVEKKENSKKLELSYSERERNYIRRAIYLAEIIVNSIESLISRTNEIFIGIEGFSFGSVGSRNLEIAGFQYILRKKLLDNLISIENLWIFSPSTIKSTAQVSKKTKDNISTKDRIIHSFYNNSLNDTILIGNDLYTKFKENDEIYKAGKSYIKPIDDLVDSYFIVKTLEQYT